MKVVKANISHLDAVAELFNDYRVFYKQNSDITAAKSFIKERFDKNDSVIFLAMDTTAKQAFGFTQLYRSYSSVSMKHIWILNDLFVTPNARKKGVASLLMEESEKFAGLDNAVSLKLATAKDNKPAQCLYEGRGWIQDGFKHYALYLK